MRSDTILTPRSFPPALSRLSSDILSAYFELGTNIFEGVERVTRALKPEAHALVDNIIAQLSRSQPELLNQLTRVVSVNAKINSIRQAKHGDDYSELFLAGMMLAHEILRSTQGERVKAIQPETVITSLRLLQREKGFTLLLEDAKRMMVADKNGGFITPFLNTFLVIKNHLNRGYPTTCDLRFLKVSN